MVEAEAEGVKEVEAEMAVKEVVVEQEEGSRAGGSGGASRAARACASNCSTTDATSRRVRRSLKCRSSYG